MNINNISKKIVLYTRLFRLPNLIILALTQYFVRNGLIFPELDGFGYSLQMGEIDFAVFVLATLLIAAAGYIINDYFDVRIDSVNRPAKLILQRHIPLRRAIFLHTAFNIAGCLAGVYAAYSVGSIKLGFIHIIICFVLWFYSVKYKRLPFAGNFTIALLAAASLYMVYLFEFYAMKQEPVVFAGMIGNFYKLNLFISAYAIFAFIFTIIREMVKDIEDIKGDKAFRCRTLPIVFGISKMRKVILILMIIALLMTGFVVYKLFEWNYNLVFWYVAVVLGLLQISTLITFIRDKENQKLNLISNTLKLTILAGVLSMQLFSIN